MITLRFMNHAERIIIGEIDNRNIRSEELKGHIIEQFVEHGFNINGEYCKITVTSNDETVMLENTIFEPKEDYVVTLSDFFPMRNAYEYTREKGIKYFFHTNEANHLYFPHIHAKYGDDEIRISLVDCDTIGEFKNQKKQKEAIKFVKENLDDMNKIWHDIIGSIT